jgi:hypothetical protein
MSALPGGGESGHVGSIARIDTLSVTDVFGDTVYIDRADRRVAAAQGRWTLFTCSRSGAMEVLPRLVLPPAPSPDI